MIEGIADSTIFVHLLRGNKLALNWLNAQGNLGVTTISWLEIIDGARGKRGQAAGLSLLSGLILVYLNKEDQDWAMQQFLTYRLSHGLKIPDCLIASAVHRLQVPIYTHNIKDFLILLPPSLVIQPYASP